MKNNPIYMKMPYSGIPAIILFMLLSVNVLAIPGNRMYQPNRDTFPEYMISEHHLILEPEFMIAKEEGFLMCDSLVYYIVEAMIPAQGTHWLIYDSSGSQTAETVNSPIARLCRLLKAYKAGNPLDLLNQYRPDQASQFSEFINDTAVLPRLLAMMSTIESFDLKAIFPKFNGAIAWLDIVHYNDSTDLMPVFLEKSNDIWYCSLIRDSSTFSYNMGFFLNNHQPWEMIGSQDYDTDGVGNNLDNCPCSPNSDQADSDGDGKGDVCDNCPSKPNPMQEDYDQDGVGDVCDNCPFIRNWSQLNSDNDIYGDTCDNCPSVFNPNQLDTDADNMGDACDPDIDGDGFPNEIDPDIDGDLIMNESDNCPWRVNPDQTDTDGDDYGDMCDNCLMVYNPEQTDSDNDGIGNVCDPDRDGDGILNIYDNCPDIPNPDQMDTDCDGIGDVCE